MKVTTKGSTVTAKLRRHGGGALRPRPRRAVLRHPLQVQACNAARRQVPEFRFIRLATKLTLAAFDAQKRGK